MNEILDLLSYTFMQRALLCGIAISFSAALIGVILTLKNYSMIGHGLGEVGFAALSLAVALNLEPIAVSIPIVIIAAIIIMFISQKKGESADIIIALVATGALAIGVIITAFTSGFGADSYNYMFGSILAMNTGKSFEEIEKVGDRDAWFTAQEALDFGLIDEIIRKKI